MAKRKSAIKLIALVSALSITMTVVGCSEKKDEVATNDQVVITEDVDYGYVCDINPAITFHSLNNRINLLTKRIECTNGYTTPQTIDDAFRIMMMNANEPAADEFKSVDWTDDGKPNIQLKNHIIDALYNVKGVDALTWWKQNYFMYDFKVERESNGSVNSLTTIGSDSIFFSPMLLVSDDREQFILVTGGTIAGLDFFESIEGYGNYDRDSLYTKTNWNAYIIHRRSDPVEYTPEFNYGLYCVHSLQEKIGSENQVTTKALCGCYDPVKSEIDALRVMLMNVNEDIHLLDDFEWSDKSTLNIPLKNHKVVKMDETCAHIAYCEWGKKYFMDHKSDEFYPLLFVNQNGEWLFTTAGKFNHMTKKFDEIYADGNANEETYYWDDEWQIYIII